MRGEGKKYVLTCMLVRCGENASRVILARNIHVSGNTVGVVLNSDTAWVLLHVRNRFAEYTIVHMKELPHIEPCVSFMVSKLEKKRYWKIN
jgi:hypothetical protein